MGKYVVTMNGDWFKTVRTNDYKQAYRMYEKLKAFAAKRGATVTVSIRWFREILKPGVLLETETINPTRIIKLN